MVRKVWGGCSVKESWSGLFSGWRRSSRSRSWFESASLIGALLVSRVSYSIWFSMYHCLVSCLPLRTSCAEDGLPAYPHSRYLPAPGGPFGYLGWALGLNCSWVQLTFSEKGSSLWQVTQMFSKLATIHILQTLRCRKADPRGCGDKLGLVCQ